MSVELIAHVDELKSGEWFIILKDTLEDSEEMCKNLEIFQGKLEVMSAQYGNDITVKWTKSPSLSPQSFMDINEKMQVLQETYSDEIDKIEGKEK